MYSDGSVKQNKSYIGQTGGAGVWCPKSKLEDITEGEKEFAEYEQEEEG